MGAWLRTRGPALAGVGALLSLCSLTGWRALDLTQGEFGYALDDAYIHMATAKQLATHGVWGVTPYAFTSAVSSPLWTLLIAAAFALTGPVAAVPGLLALVSAVGCVWIADRSLRSAGCPWTGRAVAALALVLATPLVALVFSGMEHALQIAIDLSLAAVLVERASRGRESSAPVTLLYVLAAACALVRYEGLFLVGAGAGVLWLTGERRVALRMLLVALLPLALYGILSMGHGWWPVPFPVLSRGGGRFKVLLTSASWLSGVLRVFWDSLARVVAGSHVSLLGVVAAALWAAAYRREGALGSSRQLWLVLFLAVASVHLLVAGLGHFYRYEAYLVALGVVAVGAALASAATSRVHAALVAGVLVWPLGHRALEAQLDTPRAVRNTFEQQIQMGRFLRAHFDGQGVVANDIGAICYQADVRLVDLVGFGTLEIARAKLRRDFDNRLTARLAASAGARVAVVYDPWLRQTPLPAGWIKVREWSIADNVVNAHDTVTFYATHEDYRRELLEKLQQFEPSLPPGVTVRAVGAPGWVPPDAEVGPSA